jgi:hypothetical protein
LRRLFDRVGDEITNRLAKVGSTGTGPAGVRAIANELNRRNLTTRSGGLFSSRLVHQILHRTTYIGRHTFNVTESRTKRAKPPDQHIVIWVPVIIDEATFDAVHAVMRDRHPMQGTTLLARRKK